MKEKILVSTRRFDSKKYKVYDSKHWMMIHWKINPGLFINELILGQRIPKVSLVDKTSNKPMAESTYIPCPHCNTLHDGRTWSTQNGTAFKNWFGLYCHACGEIIPCIRNVFSWLVLVITYPFWAYFKENLKSKWLAKQPQRYQNLDLTFVYDPKKSNATWIKTGLSWGFFMFITMSILFPKVMGQPINFMTIMSGLIIWTIGGLAFGYVMKKWMLKYTTNQN